MGKLHVHVQKWTQLDDVVGVYETKEASRFLYCSIGRVTLLLLQKDPAQYFMDSEFSGYQP